MLVISTIEDGNMHPSLETEVGQAQANFDDFLWRNYLARQPHVGLRVDPKRDRGDQIIDLVDVSDEDLPGRLNTVANDARLSGDALITPNHIGAFVFSADCFAISVEGREVSALCHVNNKATRDELLMQTISQLLRYEAIEDINVHVGPGTILRPNIPYKILDTLKRFGLWEQIVAMDNRATFGSKSLFSKKQSRMLLTSKPRGNHVIVMPPKNHSEED